MKIENRRARHDYFILETFEAGLVLKGAEVKSIREGRVSIKESYCKPVNGEIFAFDMHITPYEKARVKLDPKRPKKLLLNKNEIKRLSGKIKERGFALIPLALYFNHKGKAKLKIGLCRGKKMYDKKEAIKLRDIEREIRRGILSLLIFLVLPVFATTVKIKYAKKVETVDAKNTEATIYLEAEVLSKLFGCDISLRENTQQFFLSTDKRSATLAPDNPFISIDGKLFNFPTEPKTYDKKLYLPPEIIQPILKTFYGKAIKKKGATFQIYDVKITVDKIVIDPGHGGYDPGAIGPKGYPEKKAVLDIAKRAKRLIKDSLGITCILTREHDKFIPLEKRTDIANKEGVDIFISIHCNAHRSKHAKGCEVYFLSPAKTNWERLVEARENASLRFEQRDFASELKSILWDLAQNEYMHESNDLAGLLVKSICKATGTESRGVKQANFFVLRGAFMPAAFVEAEFISNPKGETELRKKDFRESIAYGIFQGIKEFKKNYEAKMNYASE